MESKDILSYRFKEKPLTHSELMLLSVMLVSIQETTGKKLSESLGKKAEKKSTENRSHASSVLESIRVDPDILVLLSQLAKGNSMCLLNWCPYPLATFLHFPPSDQANVNIYIKAGKMLSD